MSPNHRVVQIYGAGEDPTPQQEQNMKSERKLDARAQFGFSSAWTFGMAAICSLAMVTGVLMAHQADEGVPSGELIVTRHFTGLWDQVDQESQGIALQVVEQWDSSRKAVAYWYTYGPDRESAWYIGIGLLDDNRIDMDLYRSGDVGFMQDADPDNDPVTAIGEFVMTFDSCTSGTVTYNSSDPDVGTGSFRIERLAEVMNTHCTGGMSDDMPAGAMFSQQRVELVAAREEVDGSGYARYEDYPAHMEFSVDVQGLPDGAYQVRVGGVERGELVVAGGRGEVQFSSPAEDGHHFLNFDPRNQVIEVHDAQGLVLSSYEDRFQGDDDGYHGQGTGYSDADHHYDCAMQDGMGHHMGDGMMECVDDGASVEISADLSATGALPSAAGEAEWEMNSHRVTFAVEIEDVPEGSYPLVVGGVQVGIIEAFAMHDGEVYGRIAFRDPDVYGRQPLDFEPRGQLIQVVQGETVILETEFPLE